MSDYVDNTDQACFMGTSPSSPGFHQPTTLDDLDNIDWENPSYEDLANVDWAALHEDVMDVVVGESADEKLQPDRSSMTETETSLAREASDVHVMHFEPSEASLFPNSTEEKSSSEVQHALLRAKFVCDVDGCNSKSYARRGDLVRHMKKHGPPGPRECSALGCDRNGNRSFHRMDKLRDHMLDGHADDTIFECRNCKQRFSRDLFDLHEHRSWRFVMEWRTCPLPRCSFRVGVRMQTPQLLDGLQHHLFSKHTLKARMEFANLLMESGYDAQTCKIVCRVCPAAPRFPCHTDFTEHFMETHFRGPACGVHAISKCAMDCIWRISRERIECFSSVPDEVRQHRRTLLRVWPDFRWSPVWDDVKVCGPRTW